MEQFHDGHHVWLRSRVLGKYLHADDDGEGVSLRRRRASLNAAWKVHLYHGDGDDTPGVLLYNAAYGRYLAATDSSATRGCRGFRVDQGYYDQMQAEAIRWQAVRIESGDDILLRHVGRDPYHYLRANGRYLRWNKAASVDDFENVSDMMHWVVEPIPAARGLPAIPSPIRVSSPCPLLGILLELLSIGGTYRLREIVFDRLNVSISLFRDHLVVLFWLILRFLGAVLGFPPLDFQFLIAFVFSITKF